MSRVYSPPAGTLMRVVCPFCRSRMNTSILPLVSPATRFVDSELKAM
jgi:hypothetical protein